MGRLAVFGRPGHARARRAEHTLREERLEQIRDAVEQFTYALCLLLSGHDVPRGTADQNLTKRLQRELHPFLSRGDVMRPDFGAFGDLRIEGDLLQVTDPALATLEFDDRCVRQTAGGRLVPARPRRLRMMMHVAVDPPVVLDCAVSEVMTRRAS